MGERRASKENPASRASAAMKGALAALAAMAIALTMAVAAPQGEASAITVGSGTTKVLYNANGGAGFMVPLTMYKSGLTVRDCTYKKAGYTFTGWNTAANGTGTTVAPKTRVTPATFGNAASVTLYAQWTNGPSEMCKTTTVTFAANGGNGQTSAQAVKQSGTTLRGSSFYRVGYTFAGWNTAADGSGKPLASGSKVNCATFGNYPSATLYAQWAATSAQTAKLAAHPATTPISKAKVNIKKRKLYTGKAIKPAVKVTCNGRELVNGRDFTVAYKKNKKVGTATATVKGIGAYYGKKTAKFKIVKKPLIGVPELKKSDAQGTIDYLKRSGVDAKWIKSASVSVDKFDGIALPGGIYDIHPSYYGEKNKHCKSPKKKLDKLQFKVLKKFANAGKPVMGICRGIQTINVAFGGSLVQDIGGYHIGHHNMKLKKNSWLGKTFGKNLSTYHYHHQAVKKVAKGFKAKGWCTHDGKKVVEYIEHKTLPIYGFQFHPEAMGADGRKIAKNFEKECKKRM